jgi:general secretion pathway protein E
MEGQRALGTILERHGLLDSEQLEALVREAEEKRTPLLELAVSQNFATEEGIARALAEECGFPFVQTIDPEKVAIDVAVRLPISYAKAQKVLLVGETETAFDLVCADPLKVKAIDDVRALLGRPLHISVSSPSAVVNAINRVYERQDTMGELKSESELDDEQQTDLLDSDDDAPIIRWVNNLFSQAVKERASDIHIEPEEREVIVRYRVDGELYVARTASRQFMSSVIARVKIMAGLNIAEKRLPQDGRISLKIAGRPIDVRVSTVPTSRDHERIVMRLLQKTNVLLDLSDLGFGPRDHALMESLIRRPNGIVLVTGPTGSGKTTTLYGCLNRINQPNKNILTAEDPVEYELGGIHQVPINPKINLTFASSLRAFLRQDPDVIMVGEIRDKETAEIAMHASMTGHLVLSTLHTNDSAGAVTRLVEMDIEPFLVRSTVAGILAQRLIRVLCPHCKIPYEATEYELEQLGLDPKRTAWRDNRKLSSRYQVKGADYTPVGWRESTMPTFYKASGCDECEHKGYTGRRGIYELMVVDEIVGGLILGNADAQAIKRAAQEAGMDTMRDDGARKVLAGLTTVGEVVAATQEDIIFDE